MRRFLFPSLLIVLDIGAAAMAALDGDFRRVVYWVCAACLTASVTF